MSLALVNVHTTYSILDGITGIKDLVNHVQEMGMSSCAITDHGVLMGIIEFFKAAKGVGVKPIIGVEAYLTEDPDGLEDNKDKTADNYHCVLLAQNEIGLRNLYWLINNANQNNFYYKPRVNIQNFESRAEGLVATSACLGGILAKQGRVGKKRTDQFELSPDLIVRTANIMSEYFDGRFYLEIQDNNMWEQKLLNDFLIGMSKSENIPLVITADAHYLRESDHETHALIMAQQLKKTLQEYQSEDETMKYGTGFFVRSPDQMYEAAVRWGAEEAFWNTTKVAEMCNVELELGKYKSPVFDITQEADYDDFKKWSQERFSA